VTVGASLTASVGFFALILSIELARLYGNPLSKQEAIIIFQSSFLVSMSMTFTGPIYALYFVHSPIAARFGIAENIPTWYAPSLSSTVWKTRTFFHPDWIAPLSISLIATALGAIGSIALGLLAREMFIEVEELPFPFQVMMVSGVETLVERERGTLNIFAVSTLIGLVYGLALYGVPFASRAAGTPLSLLPIPWYDFNIELQRYLPGASLGVATDLMVFCGGIVLPLNVVISMFIGSFSVYFLANWLFVHFGLTPWATHWTPGMDISMILRESILYFWACPTIGIAIAAGLVPLIMHPRIISKTLKSLMHPYSYSSERVSGPLISGKIIASLFIISSLGGTFLVWGLVPTAPLWLLFLLFFGWSILSTLVSSRMLGIAGVGFEAPYINQIAIYASGYTGYDLWFAPLPIAQGSGWCATFKICQLAKTTITSYLKAWIAAFALAILTSFIFVSTLWNLAPIPSAMYPGAAIMWPVQATYQALWVARPLEFFRPEWILYSAAATGVVAALLEAAHSPISMVGIAAGISQPIPIAMTYLIGAIVAQIFIKLKGKDWWRHYYMNIGAGLVMGEGIAVVSGCAVAMILKSIWISPY